MEDGSLRDRLRREMRRGGVILAFLLLFLLLLLAFRGVMVPFLVAMFVAYLVEPLVVRMSRLELGPVRLGRVGSLLLLYTVLIGLLVLGGAILIPRGIQQVEGLAASAPATFQKVRNEWLPAVDEWLEGFGEEEAEAEESVEPETDPVLPAAGETGEPEIGPDAVGHVEPLEEPVRFAVRLTGPEDQEWRGEMIRGGTFEEKPPAPPRSLVDALDEMLQDAQTHVVDAIGVATAVLKGVVGFVYSFVLILMITAFIVIDRDRIAAFFDGLPPDRYREHYRRALRIVDAGLSGVVRGQILVCLINGALTWIGLVILGVPYSLLLAGVATVFSLIPIFGTILSSVPIVAIALTKGFGFGLAALGWITVIHLIEANVINPRVIGSTAKLHPIIIVFALLAGEHTFGVVGALLAVPAASILISTFRYARIITAAEAAEGTAGSEPATG